MYLYEVFSPISPQNRAKFVSVWIKLYPQLRPESDLIIEMESWTKVHPYPNRQRSWTKENIPIQSLMQIQPQHLCEENILVFKSELWVADKNPNNPSDIHMYHLEQKNVTFYPLKCKQKLIEIIWILMAAENLTS